MAVESCATRIPEQSAYLIGLRVPTVFLAPVRKIVRHASRDLSVAVDLLSRDLRESLASVTAAQSAAEFAMLREQYLPNYCQVTAAISSVLRSRLGTRDFSEAAQTSLRAVLENVVRVGPIEFGQDVVNEIDFCVTTMARTYRLVPRLAAEEPRDDAKAADSKLARLCADHVLWFHFHLDCLSYASQRGHRLGPEIVDALVDGLRGAVIAYSAARQAIDLRIRPVSKSVDTWDDEDAALARASDTGIV
jgi:hypothetical protein